MRGRDIAQPVEAGSIDLASGRIVRVAEGDQAGAGAARRGDSVEIKLPAVRAFLEPDRVDGGAERAGGARHLHVVRLDADALVARFEQVLKVEECR